MSDSPSNQNPIDAVRPSDAALDAYMRRSFSNLPEQAEVWAALDEGRPIQPVKTASATAGVRDELSRYPGWIQRLIIESDMRINAYDAEGFRGNAEYYRNGKVSGGYFMPSRGIETLANSVNLPVDGSGTTHPRVILRHEFGHAIDEFVRGQSYLSETSERWRAAIDAELDSYRVDVQLGLDKPLSPSDPLFMRQPLHQLEERSIGQHLSRYSRENYPTEAFAEMFRHYTSLMAEHHGNQATVDRLLSDRYRHLWPVFRDDFIPAMQEKARVIHTERQRMIDRAVASAAEAGELTGKPMSPEEQRVLAAELETQRTSDIRYFGDKQSKVINIFEDRLNTQNRPEFVHEDGVIQDYVEARREYDRAVRQDEAFRTQPDFDNRNFPIEPIRVEEHERLRSIVEQAERIVAEQGRAALYQESQNIRVAQESIYHHRGTEPPLVREEYRLPSIDALRSNFSDSVSNTELSRAPTQAAAVEAETALRDASARTRSGVPSGITPAQGEVLLDWMVNRTRESIPVNGFEPTESNLRAHFADPDKIRGACGLGQGMIGFQAEMLGLEARYHQIAALAPADASQRHAFSTVAIPVQQPDGQVVTKQYLVDTTFRQFMTEGREGPSWGETLTQTPEGRAVADQLLRNGYVELTPQVAELYIDSVRRDPVTRQPVRGDNQPWMERLATNTVDNDYSIREIVDFGKDIRTPLMVASGATPGDIVAAHPDGEMAGYPKAEAARAEAERLANLRAPDGLTPAERSAAAAQWGDIAQQASTVRSGVILGGAAAPDATPSVPRSDTVTGRSGAILGGAAAEVGAPDGAVKPASYLTPAQQRLHRAIAADPNGLVFDELARRETAADGVTAEEAATREPRPSRANIEHPRLPEIAARAAGTGVRNPYGIEQDRTPRILAEPGNARPGGASTASLFPAGFEGAAPDLRVGQGTVEQLRPTSQLRPEVAEVAPADRNASVDRVINRDAGSVLPVAANDTGVTPRSVNTTARTAPATAANDGATVTADGAAVSAAAVAAIAAAGAGSDGVHPVSEPHRGNAGNRAAGGAGLAMSTQLVQAIQEKRARGEEVSTAEYIAAGVNVGYSTLDTAGITAIDDAAARTLGGLSPRLARVGGPLVQGLLAVPMIYSAAETGDTTAIGAASFGAIGGIGAGMAGQALIPVPGVGFVIGVVVGEGAAKVGGLATTALFNDDPAMRAEALTELNQIRRDYIPNPLDPLRAPGATINLAGAAVSSVGRAVDTIGQVASWGGETVNGFASSTQQSLNTRLNQYMPPTAANILSQVAVAPIRMNGYTLQAAGTVVSGVGSVVNSVGQGVEYVGHAANDVADETTRVIGVAATETRRVVGAAAAETGRVAGRAREEFTRTYTREYERDPTLRGAARATVVATVDVAERAGNYAVRRANEALDTGREMVSSAGSWLADRTPSWLGGNAGRDRDDDETPARRAPARRAPAPAPAPARAASQVTISQQALDGLERAGWTRRLDLNGDGQLSVAEVNAAFRRHGITARQADDDRNGRLNAQEISEDLNNAIRSRRGQSSGRG